jgi:FkbM family methyltransferase
MKHLFSRLKGPEGAITSDKILIFFIKLIYLGMRILLRLALGKKRRDKLYKEKSLDFGAFCNIFFRFFRNRSNDGSNLLRFNMPEHDFEFYCRNNKDDFNIITIHEKDIIDHFNPKERDIVVDIGAHIGLYTIMASKHVGPNGKIVAIEANPDNFEMLNRNVKLNQLTNVTNLNCAVYSRETKIKLYLAGEGSNRTKYNTLIAERANEGKEKFVEVNADTLDHLMQLQGISEINWIKIDVEGAEYEVLKGASNIISHSKDISLLIEVHNLSGSNSTLYGHISQFLSLGNFKIDFEKTYDNGEKHVIARKQ